MKKYLSFLLFALAIIFVGCGRDEVEEIEPFVPDKIEAEHNFINDDFLSYIKLSTDLELDNGVIIPKYSMTSFMHIIRGLNRKILYYQVDWITSSGFYDIYYRNEFEVSTPSRFIGQRFLPFIRVEGDEIDTIKAYYKYKSSIDGVSEEKEVKFSEGVMKFNQSDFGENTNKDDVLSFNIYKFDFEDNKYHFKIEINYETIEEPIHLDMQSWIKAKDEEVYPLMGLYNYATFSEDYLSVSDEVVDGIVEIEQIYMKIKYIYNEKEYIITNIFNYNELGTLDI